MHHNLNCSSSQLSSSGTVPQSPRPTPDFYDVPCFSHRKRTPNRLPPPKAPVKSCPPVSRIFSSPFQGGAGARVVSFLSESHGESSNSQVSSPHYNPSSRQPFFEQCFDNISKLGEGSFGQVFKARFKEDGNLYAIKRSRQRFRGDDDRYRKMREVERHEKLSPHPNCIRFYKAWEERLHLYIMTELCLMSLAEYADLHGKMPENRVWNVLLDIAQGLKHLHDNRLCHLDVKPANIFIGQDGFTCKLGDFGLTVSMDIDFHHASEGDSRYIPSELLRGKFSTAADVFSLGISLLELACDLELPSEGEGWHRLRNGELPEEFIKGLSSSMVEVLSLMMKSDPDQRPTVNELLKYHSLRQIALLRPFVRTARSTGSVIKSAYGHFSNWILSLFSVILIVFRISPWRQPIHSPPDTSSSSISTEHVTPSSPNESILSRVTMDASTNCLSDSDEEMEAAFSRSFQGQSSPWSSPVATHPYHSIRYNGSPIPIEFNDPHLSSVPVMNRMSPAVNMRTSSPALSGSGNIPRVTRSEGGRRHMVKNTNIGPRNLMDMFNESGDQS